MFGNQLYVAQQIEPVSVSQYSGREEGRQYGSLNRNRKLRHLGVNTKSGQVLP